jgi:hypothetical protein
MATTKKMSAQRSISNSFGDAGMGTNIIPEQRAGQVLTIVVSHPS